MHGELWGAIAAAAAAALLVLAAYATVAGNSLFHAIGVINAGREPVNVRAEAFTLAITPGSTGSVEKLKWLVVRKEPDVKSVKLGLELENAGELSRVLKSLYIIPVIIVPSSGGWREIGSMTWSAGAGEVLVDLYGNLSAMLGPLADYYWESIENITVRDSRHHGVRVVRGLDLDRLKRGLIVRVWHYWCYNIDLKYGDGGWLRRNVAVFLHPGDWVVISVNGGRVRFTITVRLGDHFVILGVKLSIRAGYVEKGEALLSLWKKRAAITLGEDLFVNNTALIGVRAYYASRETAASVKAPVIVRVRVLETS
ncbi:MAG: hypothetical protein DSY37_03390 [Hyperthermus sp.]|nr:MAG: hypothetical protein DSY37_03390 [Hyperthermus sp.]